MIAVETTSRPSVKSGKQDASSRLTFLDWTRGLAVAIMLQGHVFHSFTRNDLRLDGPYVLSQFFGGLGPAIFLVLNGITLAFLMDKRQKQDLTATQRWVAALRRSGFLFTLAFLFRFQLWAFAAGQSPWTDLFKVDVLNCMGFSVALFSIMAIFSTVERIRFCAVLGFVIAAASPVISGIDWSWLPPQVYNYWVPNNNYFTFFPWAAFIAFGMSIGSLMRVVKPEDMFRTMQWLCLGGFGLVLVAEQFSNMPYSVYPKSEFWLNSPGLIFIKLGCVMLVMSFAYVWVQFGLKERWSWIRQLGITSFTVYWVHIELVYGRWFGSWKENLTTPQVVACAVAVILLMIGLSVLKTRWKNIRLSSAFSSLLPNYAPEPKRISGD